jgi:hypothetical protein
MDSNDGSTQLKRKKKALHRLIDAASETRNSPTDEQDAFTRPASSPTLENIRKTLLRSVG